MLSPAVTVLREFLRGKIPWFVPPPDWEKRDGTESKISGREGRLGEMAGKRKREDDDKAEAARQATKRVAREQDENEGDEDDEVDDGEFEGFEGTGVVLPGSIGDLTHFEENDEDDEEEEEEAEVENEEGPTPAVDEAGSKVPPNKEDTRPPGKKRRKG